MIVAAIILTLATGWVTLLSGLAIPLITGLVTKLDASVGTKSIVTILLSAAAGILATVVNEGGILTTDTLLNALVTWGLALGAFYGLYSPLNTDARLLPDTGIGKV